MEQTTQTTQAPQGKGMGVAGFVISLIALVFYWIIAPIVAIQALAGGGYGLGIFWLVLGLLGTGLSIMGMMKLGKTGGKRGLAITGMILGIIAVVMTVLLVMGIGKAHEAGMQLEGAFKEGMKGMSDSLSNGMKQAIEQAMDSVNKPQ